MTNKFHTIFKNIKDVDLAMMRRFERKGYTAFIHKKLGIVVFREKPFIHRIRESRAW